MSLLSWMFPAKSPAKPAAAPESSGISNIDPTRPVMRGRELPASNAQAANRKGERMARRELLYGVVREAMMRAGVLSASYKFKVLSLDGRGRQFLVMMDLTRESGMETHLFAETEAMIAQAAKARHNILVTAVYWRTNEHVAVGDPKAAVEPQPPVVESAPAPLEPQAVTRSKYEPIREDEVAAFKRAMATGVANPAAVAAAAVGVAHGAAAADKQGPHSYTLLTGFEDTELSEADGQELSGTQYGALS
ncbi:hypothetical protein GCM10027034_42910 [Ramlibacter solisilvae]|uniref:Uncharacterized protein n=1 Tax=Ramlibacter tataouinensis TaxID=94132 RepID=A0A127JTG1_9BURK|nr:hypothetical protein [Ramlibacter tataouinensis]AMO23230.1 hypothetical protein UC35_10415 [Ramlibacter tataouinensis]